MMVNTKLVTIGLVARTVYEIQRLTVAKICGGRYTSGYPLGCKFLHDAQDSVEASLHAIALIVSEILKILKMWGPERPLGSP